MGKPENGKPENGKAPPVYAGWSPVPVGRVNSELGSQLERGSGAELESGPALEGTPLGGGPDGRPEWGPLWPGGKQPFGPVLLGLLESPSWSPGVGVVERGVPVGEGEPLESVIGEVVNEG